MKNKTQEEVENIIKSKLKKLRSEIVLNSLYTDDYENSFGIDARVVQDFFDSYLEDLEDIMENEIGEEKISKMSSDTYYKELFKRDTIDSLFNYYYYISNTDLGF